MDQVKIKSSLIKVLKTIQEASGLSCPDLKGSTKPVGDLEKFDSKVWPVAIGMLASELDITIPLELNIFQKKGTNISLSIDEIVKCLNEELAAIVSEPTSQ